MSGVQKTYQVSSANRADFHRSDFENLIAQKGRNVVLEQALQCPCKSKDTNQQSNCKNCGGTGWTFINPVTTRMVIQGMNITPDYKAWSEEIKGDIRISASDTQQLTFMDRITLTDANAIHTEVLFFKVSDTAVTFAYSSYAIKKILYIGYFTGVNSVFTRLTIGTDFTFEGNVIRLVNPALVPVQGFISVTIRYQHAPVYYVNEMKRESMESFEFNSGEKLIRLPLMAIGRRAHYILDAPNLTGDRLLSNSYAISLCKTVDSSGDVITEGGNVYNFNVTQGDTFNYQISIIEAGVPVDISARTYKMQIRDVDGNLLITLSMGSGISITGLNQLTLFISSVTTAPGFYFYDLQETIGSNVETIQKGNFVVDPQITV